MEKLNCTEIKILAALTVRSSKLTTCSEGVKYDENTGEIIVPNPNNDYALVPVISDIADIGSQHYITETHFIRELYNDGETNLFRVWRKPLDTGDRNSKPTNFSAIVIGTK
jgi:hypothetical protein